MGDGGWEIGVGRYGMGDGGWEIGDGEGPDCKSAPTKKVIPNPQLPSPNPFLQCVLVRDLKSRTPLRGFVTRQPSQVFRKLFAYIYS